MAVPEQTPYIEHTGNGATTSFALKFQCETKDHLIVLVDDIEPPIATWSLTGGNVVFTTAPAAGKKITLQRNTPFSRTTDYQSYNNSFRPPAVNKDFDWIWLKLQELGVADWILGARIDALKNYVDRKDDELKAYLMEEIRKQGVALDQLDDYYNYLMQRLAQIAVDKGWDASFVVDAGGSTQQDINDFGGAKWRNKAGGYALGATVKLDNGDIVKSTIDGNTNDPNANMGGWLNVGNDSVVESIADLVAIPNPKNGSRVYVKGYYKATNFALAQPYKGGGTRVYIDSRKNENDGFLCIGGWTLIVDGFPDAYQSGAKGDGVADDIDAIQRLINAYCTTTFVSIDAQPWEISNRKVLVRAGQYRTTKPLLVGAGIEIEFENKTDQNSQTHSFKSAVLIPDFTNRLDWAIKTANYTSDGVLQAYDEFSDFDSGRVYSSCNNIKIKNAFIKPVNQIYGGIKGCYAQRSEIVGFNIQNVDYGVALTDSWASKIDGYTNHSKCGVLSLRSNNNITIDGYYTKHIATPLSGGTNLIPFKDFATSFGVFHNRGQAFNSTALVCEFNDYNLGAADSVGFVSSLYTEYAKIRSGFFHNAKVTIGVTNGYYDKATYELEDNSEVDILSWGQGGYGYGSSNTFVPLVDPTSNLKVGSGLEFYTSSIDYAENNGVIYATNIVDPTGTYNDYTGLRKKWAVPLTVAIGRAASLNAKSPRKYIIELINEGDYNLPATTISNMEIELRKSAGIASATLVNQEPLTLSNSELNLNGVGTYLPNSNSQGFNFLVVGDSDLIARSGVINMQGNNRCFARCSDGSHLKMAFNSYNWGYTMYSALVQISDTNNIGYLSFTADNSSNLTALLSRGDKGLEMPLASKIITPKFMKT